MVLALYIAQRNKYISQKILPKSEMGQIRVSSLHLIGAGPCSFFTTFLTTNDSHDLWSFTLYYFGQRIRTSKADISFNFEKRRNLFFTYDLNSRKIWSGLIPRKMVILPGGLINIFLWRKGRKFTSRNWHVNELTTNSERLHFSCALFYCSKYWARF